MIASNRVESAADILIWYRQRGEVSGERHQGELKIGFGTGCMPRGKLSRQCRLFRIGVIAPHPLSVNIVLAHRRGAKGFECRCDGKQTIRCSPLSDLGARNSTKSSTSATCCGEIVFGFSRHQALFNQAFITILPGCGVTLSKHAAAACIVFFL
ncbi:MAG: hypothetical protein IPK44_12650 [Candidatus Accumulibacter sp.]|uniref:hypothetical protein n=1 Tax=Accumulibacter sp. TaxID=2053492 RepID=UPI00258E73F1|nr:hypothetical protein [Accumulibacter sp.]MBK8115315.1 hypothetical protein [Accumulibacter sp.]